MPCTLQVHLHRAANEVVVVNEEDTGHFLGVDVMRIPNRSDLLSTY
jgi:hypothetical protein